MDKSSAKDGEKNTLQEKAWKRNTLATDQQTDYTT